MRAATLQVPDCATRFVHSSRGRFRSCRSQEARGIVAAMNRLLPTLSLLAGGVLIVIAAYALGLVAFAYAWFATGPAGRPGAVLSQPS